MQKKPADQTGKSPGFLCRGAVRQGARGVAQWNIHRAGYTFHGKLYRIAHIQNKSILCRVPMTDRHIPPKNICRNHPCKIERVFRHSELGCVTELCFLQIINCSSHLKCHSQSTDPFVNQILTECLGTQQLSI